MISLGIASLLTAASPAAAGEPPPIFELERGTAEIVWRRGDDAGLTASVTLQRPTIRLGRQIREAGAPSPKRAARKVSPFPVSVDEVAVRDGTLSFVDVAAPGRVLLQVEDVQVHVESFSTSGARRQGLPAMIAARGRIGANGHVTLFAAVDPLSEALDFAGRAAVVDLKLRRLSPFFEEELGLRTAGGTVSLFAEFSVENERIEGAVMPIFSNVEIAPAGEHAFDQLKALFAQSVVELFSDNIPGRDAVVTVIPITGKLIDPEVDVWSAMLTVVGNAFIEALAVGFRSLSPPVERNQR